ncbi:MAG: CDP-diacylglycerol--glycerol-3-phosphate 3-phosphatidyltransferase [Actinomycetes bacterium]
MLASPTQAGRWNLPNALTLLRLVLVPVLAVLLWHDQGRSTGWRLAAFAVFLVASVTDLVDGDLARRRGLVTDLGKLADPVADKALIGTTLVVLSLLGWLPWWVTVVIVAREVMVTLLRLWVVHRAVIAASRGGKLKTALQTAAVAVLILPLPGWSGPVRAVLVGAALAATVLTGAEYTRQAVRLHRVPPSSTPSDPVTEVSTGVEGVG